MKTHSLDRIQFSPSRFTADQLYDGFGELHEAMTKAGLPAEDRTTHQAIEHFGEARIDLGSTIGRTTASEFTPKLKQWDETRNDLWIGLTGAAEANLRSPKNDRRAAAERLVEVFQEGDFDRALYTASYREKASQLERIFALIDESEEIQRDLALLRFTEDWIEPLREAHGKFVEVFRAANKAEAEAGETVYRRDAVRWGTEKLRLVIEICEDYAEEGAEPYIALHRHIAEIISSFRPKSSTNASGPAGEAETSGEALTA